ncbi:GNAT family N-acetyltransferase [Mitsuaria sp. WAJ17]|uniref:GNAT family N-acetyltransferase n=1 Tax=Mitsuaria sp. WAJ17 TaxID=2761452 RepID=UPI001602248E|nr:GNAT family protein [Mitsuaria sp. WAJ17]MBB2487286.1 GNAT family N-acetyltransferase [Mitsuaria sp. WAJ17]
MSTLSLHRPQRADLEELLDFEQRERAHFETWVHARPDAFYSREGVEAHLEEAQAAADADRAHAFLIRQQGRLVGRINLHRVQREHHGRAELGYRLGAGAQGKGWASEAVGLLLPIAFETLGLWRLEAVVRPGNPASTRVLEKNGFRCWGRSSLSVSLHGRWQDLLHFERLSPAAQAHVRSEIA